MIDSETLILLAGLRERLMSIASDIEAYEPWHSEDTQKLVDARHLVLIAKRLVSEQMEA